MKTLEEYKEYLKHNAVYPLDCCVHCSWRRECWEIETEPQPYCQELMLEEGFSKYKKITFYKKDEKFYYIIEQWDGSITLESYGAKHGKYSIYQEAEAALRKLCGRLPRKTDVEDYQD